MYSLIYLKVYIKCTNFLISCHLKVVTGYQILCEKLGEITSKAVFSSQALWLALDVKHSPDRLVLRESRPAGDMEGQL